MSYAMFHGQENTPWATVKYFNAVNDQGTLFMYIF